MSSSPKNSGSASIDEKYTPSSIENGVQDEGFVVAPAKLFTPEESAKIWRKVDYKIIPILSFLYLLSFLDRGNVGNARGYGLERDLNMSGSDYNVVVSVFFLSYCLCEPVANVFLNYFGPTVWLSSITLVWGAVVIGMGFPSNFAGLAVARVMLGIAEAGLFPGVVFLLSSYYPRSMTQGRIACFFGAATVAGAFSGLLAFGIGFLGTTSVAGLRSTGAWRWIFILEGAATMAAGILAYFTIVASPQAIKSLTSDEKAWIKYQKDIDLGPAGEDEKLTFSACVSGVCNIHTMFGLAYYQAIVVPLYSIGLGLPQIIKSFSPFTIPQVQLLTIPVYVVAVVWVVFSAIWSDRKATRYPFLMTDLVATLIGFIIQITDAPYGAKYFGLFLAAAGSYGGLPSVVSWLSNNIVGRTRRSIAVATQVGLGNLGALISINAFRTVDAPRYIPGYGAVIGCIVIGLVAAPTYAYVLKKENARRDAEQVYQDSLPEDQRRTYTPAELRALGDCAPTFRYMI